MKEEQFVHKNISKWKQIEAHRSSQHQNADEVAQDYIELNEDLAFARTFYPGSDTVKYLNGLAGTFHKKIYRNKREDSHRIFWFWQYEIPVLLYGYRRYLVYALALFLAFVWIGSVSALHDQSYIRLILGDGYVDMTLDNIRKGNPFGVYAGGNSLEMFLRIAVNNIRVSLMCFGSGIVPGLGPVFLCMYNAIMVGAFETFFFLHHIGARSMSVIMLHGTLELWSIVVGTAAGLIFSAGILFPGTYPRSYTIQRNLLAGLKITIGLMPLFIVAAFIEGFVTRYGNEMPFTVAAAIIGLSSVFLAWYFFLYPAAINSKIKNSSTNNLQQSKNFTKWLQAKYN